MFCNHTYSFIICGVKIQLFATQCYASAAYANMQCLSILSVCPSVTFMNSVKTSKHIFKIFPSTDSQTILVFFIPNVMAIFRCGPPNGAVECRWGRRFSKDIWLGCVL